MTGIVEVIKADATYEEQHKLLSRGVDEFFGGFASLFGYQPDTLTIKWESAK